jgi:signal transduction histidine kinase
VLEQFRRRLQLVLLAGAQIGLSVTGLVLVVFTILGGALIVVWVGLPILFVSMTLARAAARLERKVIGAVIRSPVADPYLPSGSGNLVARLGALARDPATWRDALWLTLTATIGLALGILALVEGVLDLLIWWIPAGISLQANAYASRALLAPNERTELARRVQVLTETRAETVDTSAAELRRIERDLHDGAQARLVALGMNLSLAEELLSRDPEAARKLLAESRADSSTALAELRDLVRGIHPPVLADRGLVGAVQALALTLPIPIEVDADIPGRLSAPVESAAYFAVAEALANLGKHSRARVGVVCLTHAGDTLRIEVRDDGIGGADAAHGTGLRGIERRLAAFDGTLAVASPTGGPTIVTIVLPCVSSSPRTSPSSGTG